MSDVALRFQLAAAALAFVDRLATGLLVRISPGSVLGKRLYRPGAEPVLLGEAITSREVGNSWKYMVSIILWRGGTDTAINMVENFVIVATRPAKSSRPLFGKKGAFGYALVQAPKPAGRSIYGGVGFWYRHCPLTTHRFHFSHHS
jgi:hypothetical protein